MAHDGLPATQDIIKPPQRAIRRAVLCLLYLAELIIYPVIALSDGK